MRRKSIVAGRLAKKDMRGYGCWHEDVKCLPQSVSTGVLIVNSKIGMMDADVVGGKRYGSSYPSVYYIKDVLFF